MKTKIASLDPGLETSFTTYMKEIRQYPLLTREEEVQCGTLIQTDPHSVAAVTARERLITCNLRWVVKLAHKYHKLPLSFFDAVQEGNLGLCTAVDRFDPRRFDNRFATYATCWIVNAIHEANCRAPIIELSARRHARIQKIRRHLDHGALARQNDIDQIVAETGLSRREVLKCLSLDFQFVSLQSEPHEDSGVLEGALPDPAAHPVNDVMNSEEQQLARVALEDLNPSDAQMVREYFGLDTSLMTMSEIAERHGSTRHRVQRAIIRSLALLRRRLAPRFSKLPS